MSGLELDDAFVLPCPPTVVLYKDAAWCAAVARLYPGLLLWLVRVSRQYFRLAMQWLWMFWATYRVWVMSPPVLMFRRAGL